MNLAVLVLAEHQLGHPDEAAAALTAASQILTRFKEDRANRGSHDLLIAEILFREAEAKINDKLKPDAAGKSEAVPPKTTDDR
jgi:hypothetical protein